MGIRRQRTLFVTWISQFIGSDPEQAIVVDVVVPRSKLYGQN